jgi:spore coat polysaccharide biosynthesis predicted glycosyltransferase SpsG
MPKILFRADANERIGSGDLLSLFYLSESFQKKGWKSCFLVKDHEMALKIINKNSIGETHIMPKDIKIEEEIRIIDNLCNEKSIDCLFMEITENDLHAYETLGRPAAIKACVNFDGIVSKDFDLIVNWCVDSKSDIYNYISDAKQEGILVGFDKVILPDHFDRGNLKKKEIKDIKNILITMGGLDEFDMTAKVLKSLAVAGQDIEVRVIAGPGYKGELALTEYAGKYFNNFSVRCDAKDLFGDYLWSDICISAGGLTSSELVATKTPAILIATYEHQIKRCEYFHKMGWAYYVGYFAEQTEEDLFKAFNYLRENIVSFHSVLADISFRGGNEEIFNYIDNCRQSR